MPRIRPKHFPKAAHPRISLGRSRQINAAMPRYIRCQYSYAERSESGVYYLDGIGIWHLQVLYRAHVNKMV